MSEAPRIVVLDGFALNPGDLNWQALAGLGELQIYDRTSPDEVVSRANAADAVLTNKAVLPRESIEALPSLKYIGVLATGYNIVDVVAARDRGIPVCNVPIYGTNSVAQMVFAHLLNLTQRTAEHAQAVTAGRWATAEDWCFWDFPLCELEGSTIGIVGLGRIGQATAKIANAFGMRVLGTSRTKKEAPSYIEQTDLETLFRSSDVISLHCPLTDETEGMVNAERLAMMKPTAFLINTGRGQLIDENALADSLNDDRLAGAGLDVMCVEPPTGDHPLFHAKNCYVTPHIAWATQASRARLMNTAVENVAAFLSGNPQNVVNA